MLYEPLKYDNTQTKLMLKTKHQKVIVNSVRYSQQVHQTQSRNLATVGCKKQDLVVGDLYGGRFVAVELTIYRLC